MKNYSRPILRFMNRRDFLKRSLAGTALTTIARSLPNNCFGNELVHKFDPLESGQHYARMFPQLAATEIGSNSRIEEGLIKLAENMRDDPKVRPDQKQPPPMAGYTYLGQFLNHDLSLDLTPLDKVQPNVGLMTNLRTPSLDLDHVYGGGPRVSPFLYDRKSRHGEEKFILGETASSVFDDTDFPATENDLPRNSQGIALVADSRQDENLIIAQLHVAFLKLHNRVLEKPGRFEETDLTPFEQARRTVTWHYQWVVRHDFLRQILDPEVFEETFRNQQEQVKRGTDFQIPVEYSLAAGRFGHSMVREEYFVNNNHPEASLKNDILRLTGAGGGACPRLPADWVIDWERFFFVGAGSGLVRRSRAIDTRLAQALHEPDHPKSQPLPVKTLLRGQRAGIPSGQDVARAIGLRPLEPEQIVSGPNKEILVRFGFDKRTPLWYYLLKEAELTAKGAHLGTLGSKLVAEVIMRAIMCDPNSYFSVDQSWVPTLPGPDEPELFGMADLLRVAIKS